MNFSFIVIFLSAIVTLSACATIYFLGKVENKYSDHENNF